MSEVIENNIPENNEPEEIEVRSDIEAGWQLKRRKEIIADRDELIAFYKERIKAVEEDAAFKIGMIDRALYAFFLTVPHKRTKTQESYSHPLGKLLMKKQNPEYKHDDKTVIAWLEKNNGTQYIKTKKELDWAGLKSAGEVVDGKLVIGETITDDGEIIQITVPGVEVIDREEKFVVEV